MYDFRLQITKVKHISITANIKYMHFGEIVAGSVDMRAEVGVLARSVVIEGEVETVCPEYNGNCDAKEVRKLDTFGAHVKVGDVNFTDVLLFFFN